jgi:hypothetical protein
MEAVGLLLWCWVSKVYFQNLETSLNRNVTYSKLISYSLFGGYFADKHVDTLLLSSNGEGCGPGDYLEIQKAVLVLYVFQL